MVDTGSFNFVDRKIIRREPPDRSFHFVRELRFDSDGFTKIQPFAVEGAIAIDSLIGVGTEIVPLGL